MIESPYLKDNEQYIAQLRSLTGFTDLDDSITRDLLALSKVRRYEPGEVIITEGSLDCWLYFLIHGVVRIKKGSTIIHTMRRTGDIFGEMGIIDAKPRSATVTAAKPSLCLAMDASCLDRLQGDSKYMVQALLYKIFAEKMAERLRLMNDENQRLKERIKTFENAII